MNDFTRMVNEVRELSTLAHHAATHASVASKKAESAVLAMVFVAILIVASLMTSARELNVKRAGRETNIEIIAFLVATATVVFVALTVIIIRMSETAGRATDASAAAARALIGMEVVEQAVIAAAERARDAIEAVEETV